MAKLFLLIMQLVFLTDATLVAVGMEGLNALKDQIDQIDQKDRIDVTGMIEMTGLIDLKDLKGHLNLLVKIFTVFKFLGLLQIPNGRYVLSAYKWLLNYFHSLTL